MLEELGSIAWSQLGHGYGYASDVPEQIRSLAVPDPATREKAYNALYSNIFHQGTRYEATRYAVPFLFELIGSEAVPERQNIIYLLIGLALGYEEEYLPAGLDVAVFRHIRQEAELHMSDSTRRECAEAGIGPRVELDCYDAVRSGVPGFIRLLDDSDPGVRRAATYALAWFPEDAAGTIPVLEALLQRESQEINTANALLSIGLLARTSRTSASACTDFLIHESFIVRVASSIALAVDPIDQRVLNALLEAVVSPARLDDFRDELQFNEGDLVGYAGLQLSASGASLRATIVPVLCKALGQTRGRKSSDSTARALAHCRAKRILCLARALLDLTFESPEPPCSEPSIENLDDLQLTALRALQRHGQWSLNNFARLLEWYGLPHSRPGMLQYLESKAK